MKIKKTTIVKLIFLVALCSIIIYTFRHLAKPIFQEIIGTPVSVIVMICIFSVIYEVVEGWISYTLAKVYNPEITFFSAVGSAFYCCFYRLASAGTGTGMAAVLYFNDRGVEYSKATGMYTLQYAFHRVGLALFSLIFLIVNWRFMSTHYGPYKGILISGFLLTAAISTLLLFICLSKKAHRMINRLVDWINRNGKIERYVDYIRSEIQLFELGSRDLFGNRVRVLTVLAQNLLKQFFWCAIPYIILQRSTGYSVSECLAVTALCVTCASVIPSPGGIGSSEFAFILMFSVIVDQGRAGSVALLYRFATFVMPFLLGILVAIPQKNKHKPLFIKEEIRKP